MIKLLLVVLLILLVKDILREVSDDFGSVTGWFVIYIYDIILCLVFILVVFKFRKYLKKKN